jgi:NAD(P)-dependent dehydrogenase (short-subunit alcohol dehydrogenase family)
MKEFRGKVAVVTGAASGIGRALADRCVQEGMKVVLADIEEAALAQAEQQLKDSGATVLAMRTDVSKADDVESLAGKTIEAFGAVHLLFNNAGVAERATLWESSLADWQWIIGVNLWGVIHGVRSFVPLMLKQGDECHVVNTASIAGLISGVGIGTYKVTKHAVVALSETLACELAAVEAKVKVSVLCPGGVNTRIMEAERNRPRELQNTVEVEVTNPANLMFNQMLEQLVQTGTPPSEIAGAVFDAIRNEKFYILPHAEWKPAVQKRMEDILLDRNPFEVNL